MRWRWRWPARPAGGRGVHAARRGHEAVHAGVAGARSAHRRAAACSMQHAQARGGTALHVLHVLHPARAARPASSGSRSRRWALDRVADDYSGRAWPGSPPLAPWPLACLAEADSRARTGCGRCAARAQVAGRRGVLPPGAPGALGPLAVLGPWRGHLRPLASWPLPLHASASPWVTLPSPLRPCTQHSAQHAARSTQRAGSRQHAGCQSDSAAAV